MKTMLRRRREICLELLDYMLCIDSEWEEKHPEIISKDNTVEFIESYYNEEFESYSDNIVRACIRHVSYLVYGKMYWSGTEEILQECGFSPKEIDFYFDTLY